MEGFIYLHRKLLDNPICQNPKYFSLWIILLLKASYIEKEMMWNGGVVKLKPGQFITGREQLSKESGIPQTTVERILDYLQKQHQIGQQKNNRFRIITIENWDKYQLKQLKTDNQRTTNGQPTDTINKDNKEKNEYIAHYLKRIKDIEGDSYKPQIPRNISHRISELLKDFKPPDIIEAIDYYFDQSNKGEKCGYDLSVILNAHSINQWQDYAK